MLINVDFSLHCYCRLKMLLLLLLLLLAVVVGDSIKQTDAEPGAQNSSIYSFTRSSSSIIIATKQGKNNIVSVKCIHRKKKGDALSWKAETNPMIHLSMAKHKLIQHVRHGVIVFLVVRQIEPAILLLSIKLHCVVVVVLQVVCLQ